MKSLNLIIALLLCSSLFSQDLKMISARDTIIVLSTGSNSPGVNLVDRFYGGEVSPNDGRIWKINNIISDVGKSSVSNSYFNQCSGGSSYTFSASPVYFGIELAGIGTAIDIHNETIPWGNWALNMSGLYANNYTGFPLWINESTIIRTFLDQTEGNNYNVCLYNFEHKIYISFIEFELID
jgi:hypothetical protein